MKKYLEEIPKGALKALGGVLLLWLLAAIPKATSWVEHLSLTDTEAVAIRLALCFAGVLLLGGVGWFVFFRARQKIRSLEQELIDAQKLPNHFQDDYTFDSRLGLYRHKSKPGFYCPKCALKEIPSPLKESPTGWQCLADEAHWYENPDYVPF
jgi:hypothetical protein